MKILQPNRLLASAAVLLLLSFSAFAQDNLVIPGKSVGAVRLGDVRDAALNTLGKPSKTKRWRNGLIKDSWLGPEPPSGSSDSQLFLNIIYRARRVVQIEFNDPKYKTAAGISIESTLARFRAKHRRPRARAYAYIDDGSGFVGYYYDDVAGGIAFSFGTQDYFDATVIPEALRVHVAGQPVIPDPGGKPTRANDERPIEKPQRHQHAVKPRAASSRAGDTETVDISMVIQEFWSALGRLDSEALKGAVDWPLTIVEASNLSNKSNVLRDVREFDEEFNRSTTDAARQRGKSEFYGMRPQAVQVRLLNRNLASVSYVCQLPRDIRDASTAHRLANFKALTILRRDPNAANRWQIIFITVPK